jgi:hypothetical protein
MVWPAVLTIATGFETRSAAPCSPLLISPSSIPSLVHRTHFSTNPMSALLFCDGRFCIQISKTIFVHLCHLIRCNPPITSISTFPDDTTSVPVNSTIVI